MNKPNDAAEPSLASAGSVANDQADVLEKGIANIIRIADEPDWIPVTERLPPPGFGVLIFFGATDNDGTPSGIGCDGNGGLIAVAAMDRIDGQCLWTSEYGDETPTHWMPLPAPPTDGK